MLNLIICELDIASTPFCDAKIITYEIEQPPGGNKLGLGFLDDKYFTVPYIMEKIPNSNDVHKLST